MINDVVKSLFVFIWYSVCYIHTHLTSCMHIDKVIGNNVKIKNCVDIRWPQHNIYLFACIQANGKTFKNTPYMEILLCECVVCWWSTYNLNINLCCHLKFVKMKFQLLIVHENPVRNLTLNTNTHTKGFYFDVKVIPVDPLTVAVKKE